MAVLLTVGATRSTAFKAFDCNNASAPIEQYSLLDPEPCGNMQKVHAVERDLHEEIVQIKKERLVQVTKCIVFQTITSTYCGFQSGAGVPRYVKFRTPLTIEPADCRISAKLGKIKISGKEHPFEMGVKTDFSVYLVGGLDAQGNCEVGAYEVNGEMLTGQVVQASYEVDIKQVWARANDLTGTIKLTESLVATTTDRATVDSGEGTYVWDFSQDACPDTLVSLYSGPIKVLTNSTTTFTDGKAIVSGRDKNQVAGLELKETMVLCGRAAQKTHIKNIAVFFHPMEQIQVASGKFWPGDGRGRVHPIGIRAELPAGQIDYVAAGDHPTGEGRDMREQEASRAPEAGEHRRSGEPLQPHGSVRQRTPSDQERRHGVRNQMPASGGHPENTHQLHQ